VLLIKRLLYIWLAICVATVTLLPIDSEAATEGSFTITVTVGSVTSSITTPASGEICSQIPTVIGTATANKTVSIEGTSSGIAQEVASTTSDGDGNFAVQVDSGTPLDTGDNTLTPHVDGSVGTSVTVTVEADPSPEDEPQITSPEDQEKVKGKRPTITGQAEAGQIVELFCKDKDGNITSLGTTTVEADGTFSITPSSDLSPGTAYLYVTVDGVASPLIEVVFVDPYGIVFDSETNEPIKGATLTLYYDDDPTAGRDWIVAQPEDQIAEDDENPQTTGEDGEYAYDVIDGDYYFDITSDGYDYPSTKTSFPSDRTIVTGSKAEVFTVSGEIIEMDQPMDFEGSSLLIVTKDANKKEVSIGDVITYTVYIENTGSSDVDNIHLKDDLAGGLKYLPDTAQLDGASISNPTGTTTKTFDIGTVSANSSVTLKYQVVVGSGVTFGEYENSAWCAFSNGRTISNISKEKVTVVPDVLFDLGTVIGKVFLDRNQDGIQNEEEPGLSDVRIVTEDGTVITTDQHGKYHLSSILPGRHILRADETTLPEDSYFTTDKAKVVDVTAGTLNKVNFGVYSKQKVEEKDLPVKIIQKKQRPEPFLNVGLYPTPVVSYKHAPRIPDKEHQEYEFRIFTNYQLFIDEWKVEIADKDTEAVVRSFEGSQLTINDPIFWDGKDSLGRWLDPERDYVYTLTVTGKDGNQDKTKEKPLPVESYKPQINFNDIKENDKASWLKIQSSTNSLRVQTIEVGRKVVLIQNKKTEGKNKQQEKKQEPLNLSVKIDDVIIPVFSADRRNFKQEIILTDDNYEIVIETKTEKGRKQHRLKEVTSLDGLPFFVVLSSVQ
jgi:uncharacterized repeat protein (TIGR01451 family)